MGAEVPQSYYRKKEVAPSNSPAPSGGVAPEGKGSQPEFKKGDRVQDQIGEIGTVEAVEKKPEAGEPGSDSTVAEQTTYSPTPPASSAITTPVVASASPANGGTGISIDKERVLCKLSGRAGKFAPEIEPWEGRTWVLWEGETDSEPIRNETLWRPGDRCYKTTGKRGTILGWCGKNAWVRWDNGMKSATHLSHLRASMPPKKENDFLPFFQEPEQKRLASDAELNKLMLAAIDLLEGAGYDWDAVELPTLLPEAKITPSAGEKKIGEIWFFDSSLFAEYFPEDCPAGGAFGEWIWVFDSKLSSYLDSHNPQMLASLQEVKLWQLVELPIEDVN